MKQFETLDDYFLHRLRERPEELPDFLTVELDETQRDGNWAEFCYSLRMAVESRGGVGELAEALGCSRTSLYKTFSGRTKPRLETVSAILNHLGLRLAVVPVGASPQEKPKARKAASRKSTARTAVVSEPARAYGRGKKKARKAGKRT